MRRSSAFCAVILLLGCHPFAVFSQDMGDVNVEGYKLDRGRPVEGALRGEDRSAGVAADFDMAQPSTPGPKTGEWFLHKILKDQYGKKDLATTAILIKAATENNSPFVWTTGEDKGDLPNAGSIEQLLKARNMACYEFVHYAAYFAGHQPSRLVFDDVPDEVQEEDPEVSTAELLARGYKQRPSILMSIVDTDIIAKKDRKVWDRNSTIPRGAVVYGVSRISSTNNKGGYYHVGISLGNNTVMSLRGKGPRNLQTENIDDVFGRLGYSEVIYGPYNYSAQPSRR